MEIWEAAKDFFFFFFLPQTLVEQEMCYLSLSRKYSVGPVAVIEKTRLYTLSLPSLSFPSINANKKFQSLSWHTSWMSPKEMKGFRAVVAAPGQQCRWQLAQNRADPTLTGKRVMLCAGFSGVPISLTEDTQEVVFSHLRSYKKWNDHKEDPRFSQLGSNLGYFHPVSCRGISLTLLALTGRTQAKWVATTDCYNDHLGSKPIDGGSISLCDSAYQLYKSYQKNTTQHIFQMSRYKQTNKQKERSYRPFKVQSPHRCIVHLLGDSWEHACSTWGVSVAHPGLPHETSTETQPCHPSWGQHTASARGCHWALCAQRLTRLPMLLQLWRTDNTLLY